MENAWFGICLFLLLESPASLWAQSPPILPPSASGDGMTHATIAEQFGENENGNLNDRDSLRAELGLRPGSLTALPDDGRGLYFQAIDAAKNEIRIEICVLEDPQILEHLQAALQRSVRIRAIVDREKYDALASEQPNLARYLTSAGGQLHLSNSAFPRSFPKIILVDSRLLIYGSACLDETTFLHYRQRHERVMHARAAVVDGKIAYLGSISLSPDSITFNRVMGLILRQRALVRKLEAQFQSDHDLLTTEF
jgi:phosphatidylserine/phosphatidylglycerophosphate/cardiolipin synthase-like enzyme